MGRQALLLGLILSCGFGCKSGSECSSTSDCASGEVCSGGVCSTACNVSSECDPGQVCDGGVCTNSSGVSCTTNAECDDGNPCTLDACSMELRLCVSASAPEGTMCGDDGNPCTAQSCDGGGVCAVSNVSGTCDDGDACSDNDVCVDGVCLGGGAVNCDDSNECTSEVCDPGVGCVFTQINGACDDGNACTTDTCESGVCVGTVPGCPLPRGCEIAPSGCTSMSCVYDIATAGTPCRSVNGPCDVEETCDGVSRDCPTDEFVTAGAPCRAAPEACDVVEQCTGAGPDCPADGVASMGTECNASLGACDPAEVCDGSSKTCPDDELEDMGFVCGPASGECDAVEVCGGSSPECPADVNEMDGTVCGIGLCVAGTCVPPATVLIDPLGEEVAAGFGDALVIAGDELFVGTPKRGLMANPDWNRGMVHLYRRNASSVWTFDETILPPESTTQEQFGEHLALSGDTLAIGADRTTFMTGAYVAIYVRSGDTWAHQQTIPNVGDTAVGRTFGNRLALDGDTLVSGDNTSTHVYVRSGSVWSLQQTIPLEGDRVALRGDRLAITNNASELVHLYTRSGSTWTFETSFGPAVSESDDNPSWGIDLVLVDDMLIVGASERDEAGPANAGRVYTYRRIAGVWQAPEILAAPTPVSGARFGSSLGLDGDRLVVGASGDSEATTGAGAVFLFERSGGAWQFVDKLTPSPASEDDGHGFSAAVVSGNWVSYAGENADVSTEVNAGRVFVEFVDW